VSLSLCLERFQNSLPKPLWCSFMFLSRSGLKFYLKIKFIEGWRMTVDSYNKMFICRLL